MILINAFFNLFSVGNVNNESDHKTVVLLHVGAQAHLYRKAFAGFFFAIQITAMAHNAVLRLVIESIAELNMALLVLLWNQQLHLLPDDFVCFIAKHPAGGRIDKNDIAQVICNYKTFGGIFKEGGYM